MCVRRRPVTFVWCVVETAGSGWRLRVVKSGAMSAYRVKAMNSMQAPQMIPIGVSRKHRIPSRTEHPPSPES